jgi:hypothetical protein
VLKNPERLSLFPSLPFIGGLGFELEEVSNVLGVGAFPSGAFDDHTEYSHSGTRQRAPNSQPERPAKRISKPFLSVLAMTTRFD